MRNIYTYEQSIKMAQKTFLLFGLIVILLLSSCRKDEDFLEDPVIEIPDTEEVGFGELQGVVYDENNNILAGALVQLHHYDMLVAETSSDNQGAFTINDFAAIDEYTLSVTKDEYVSYVNNISEEQLDGEQVEINLVSSSFITASGTIGMIDPQDSTLISISGRIINNQGIGVSQTIALVFTEDFYFGNITITDFDGSFSILVPKNQNIVMSIFSNCIFTLEPDVELGSFDADQDIGDIVFDSGQAFELFGSVIDCSGDLIEEGSVNISYFGMNGIIDESVEVSNGLYSWTTSDCISSGVNISYIDESGQVRFESWLQGLFEEQTEFNIPVCDTIISGVGVLSFVADSSVYVINDLIGINSGVGILVYNTQTTEPVFSLEDYTLGDNLVNVMSLQVGNTSFLSTYGVTVTITQLPEDNDPFLIGQFEGEFFGTSTGTDIIITGDFSIPIF